MKKFTLVSLVAAAAFATTAAFSASNVFADDTTATTPATGTAGTAGTASTTGTSTDGTINLTPADGTDTTSPYKDITLVKASNIGFGNKTISTKAETYTAEDATGVNVVNPGIASGWSVTANASAFTGAKGSTLKGAVLTLGLDDGTAADKTNQSTAPTGTKGLGTDDNKDGVAISGADETVLNASDSLHGVGDWTAAVNKAATTLYVPAGNVSDNYTASINWTLTNAPAK